jgi:hypothetical protein
VTVMARHHDLSDGQRALNEHILVQVIIDVRL